jgi:hypothetical protein
MTFRKNARSYSASRKRLRDVDLPLQNSNWKRNFHASLRRTLMSGSKKSTNKKSSLQRSVTLLNPSMQQEKREGDMKNIQEDYKKLAIERAQALQESLRLKEELDQLRHEIEERYQEATKQKAMEETKQREEEEEAKQKAEEEAKQREEEEAKQRQEEAEETVKKSAKGSHFVLLFLLTCSLFARGRSKQGRKKKRTAR